MRTACGGLLEEFAGPGRGGEDLRLQVIDLNRFRRRRTHAMSSTFRRTAGRFRAEDLYFGLAGTNSTDGRAVIDFFNRRRREFWSTTVSELDWSWRLARWPKKPVIRPADATLPMSADFSQMTRGSDARPLGGQPATGTALHAAHVATARLPASIRKSTDVLIRRVHPRASSRKGALCHRRRF